ncbi:Respiratory supercomplex factor 1, mitochondrial [Basidiobolus ranarum]|uniref:Respiratory supercomplex factor 1, mitochondrial n=1 Tax=Basidiobolus ranarum TaxID=34480 RepID=A0ABR2WT65_9FUNG
MSSVIYEEDFKSSSYENAWQRMIKNSKEQPLVVIGTLATIATLVGATLNLKKGNRVAGQQFLKYRIYSQTFTLLALAGGSMYYASKRENKSNMNTTSV